jgi:beta-glucosidase/6-phospho-beta-glucosidase/beta-galactosidase
MVGIENAADASFTLGVNSHRMSLSWSRIIPAGKAGSEVNEKGIQFYRKVIKALLDAGIVSACSMIRVGLR